MQCPSELTNAACDANSYLQCKQRQLKHLERSANANHSQCLDYRCQPEQQDNLPAKEYEPDDVGYASQWMKRIGPR